MAKLEQNGIARANVVQAFTFTNAGGVRQVTIYNNLFGNARSDLWCTIDGSDPTVQGTNEIYVPQGTQKTEQLDAQAGSSTIVVKVIAQADNWVAVELR